MDLNLFASVTAITNVSVKNKNANCNIIVHKWGNTYKINKRTFKDQILIDDSADSFPTKNFDPMKIARILKYYHCLVNRLI